MAVSELYQKGQELRCQLLHLSGYVGVPLVREAMLTAKEVFGEMRKER